MSGAAARHYRVSFITLHWYGRDFATQTAVSELQSYIQAVWARYHKPIWLTAGRAPAPGNREAAGWPPA